MWAKSQKQQAALWFPTVIVKNSPQLSDAVYQRVFVRLCHSNMLWTNDTLENIPRTNRGHRKKSGASLVKQSKQFWLSLHGSGWELRCTQITQFHSCFICNNKGVWDYRGAGSAVLNERDYGRCSNRRLSKSDKNVWLLKTKNWNWYFCNCIGMRALNPSLLSSVRRTFQSSQVQNGKQILY